MMAQRYPDSANTWASELAHTWTTTPPLDQPPTFTNLETPTFYLRILKNIARLGRAAVYKLGLRTKLADSYEDWREWAAGDERALVAIWGRQGTLSNDTGSHLGFNDMGPLRFDGLTDSEARSEVLMWMMLKSPLFVSGDLNTISPDVVRLLKHPDLLKLNRGEGKEIDALMKRGKAEVWARTIENGGAIVVLVNRDSLPATLGFDFRIIPGVNYNLTFSISTLFGSDLLPEHLGYFAQRYVTKENGIPERGVVVYELTVAEGVDEDRIVVPDLPKSRKDKIKEMGEAMKAQKIAESRMKREKAAGQAASGKEEL